MLVANILVLTISAVLLVLASKGSGPETKENARANGIRLDPFASPELMSDDGSEMASFKSAASHLSDESSSSSESNEILSQSFYGRMNTHRDLRAGKTVDKSVLRTGTGTKSVHGEELFPAKRTLNIPNDSNYKKPSRMLDHKDWKMLGQYGRRLSRSLSRSSDDTSSTRSSSYRINRTVNSFGKHSSIGRLSSPHGDKTLSFSSMSSFGRDSYPGTPAGSIKEDPQQHTPVKLGPTTPNLLGQKGKQQSPWNAWKKLNGDETPVKLSQSTSIRQQSINPTRLDFQDSASNHLSPSKFQKAATKSIGKPAGKLSTKNFLARKFKLRHKIDGEASPRSKQSSQGPSQTQNKTSSGKNPIRLGAFWGQARDYWKQRKQSNVIQINAGSGNQANLNASTKSRTSPASKIKDMFSKTHDHSIPNEPSQPQRSKINLADILPFKPQEMPQRSAQNPLQRVRQRSFKKEDDMPQSKKSTLPSFQLRRKHGGEEKAGFHSTKVMGGNPFVPKQKIKH